MPVRGGPFLRGEQAGGGAVGERGGVGGGQRAAAGGLVERRLQRCEFLQRGIRAQDVVARHAAETDDQVIEEAALVGGGELLVRGQRPLVLRVARDVPFLGHVLAVVAHRLAGARLGDAGEVRLEFAEVEALERAQLVLGRLGHRGIEQAATQLLAVHDRHVGRGIGAATDADVDLAGRDLVGDGHDRVERGAAGALHGDARCQRRQSGGQRGLAAEVPVAGMLDHRAHRDFAQLLAVQAELLDQRAEGADRHAEVADVRVGGVLAAERNTDAAEHGNGTDWSHLTPSDVGDEAARGAEQPRRGSLVRSSLVRIGTDRHTLADGDDARECSAAFGSDQPLVRVATGIPAQFENVCHS